MSDSDFSDNPVRRIASAVIAVESDYRKLVEDGNSAAGGRVRKAALEAVSALKQLRKDVQELRNSAKAD